MGALYKITFPNGKAYIGITADTAEGRFAEHAYNSATNRADRPLNRAFRKYGRDAARLQTLVVADDWKYLCALERRAIAAYGTKGRGGYNATEGGEGSLGYRHTPDALRRMGEVHKGKAHHSVPHSDAAKAKMSAARKGRKLGECHRASIAAALVGNTYSLGVKHAPESVAKRAQSLIANSTSRVTASGVRGVSWCPRTGKWRAHISPNGKMRDLGRHDTIEAAAMARQKAAAEYLAGGASNAA